jgi:hypothetical protein
MGTKTKQIQNPYQNNSTSYVEESPDLAAARTAANQTTNDLLPPALQAQYDRARQKSANRTNSAYNAATPVHLRNAQQNMQERDLLGDQGIALAQGAYDQNQAGFARKLALADMTAKRQQTGSGYSTQSFQQQSPWASIGMGALSIGSKFL